MKIAFINCDGKKDYLDDALTIEDLVKLGINLNLEPNEKPKSKDPRMFYHTPEPPTPQKDQK